MASKGRNIRLVVAGLMFMFLVITLFLGHIWVSDQIEYLALGSDLQQDLPDTAVKQRTSPLQRPVRVFHPVVIDRDNDPLAPVRADPIDRSVNKAKKQNPQEKIFDIPVRTDTLVH